MEFDPALTQDHVDALNSVDLWLLGVTHGIMRRTGVESITDTDYQAVKDAVDQLDASRGMCWLLSRRVSWL